MSYLVLARKSRPQTFDQVVGQKPIVKTLKNSLVKERVAHAILFSGVRGVGKTTLARIMAKAINCEAALEQRPCDACDSCREITKGSAIDIHEIDGASNRGIHEIRELKEKLKFLPSSSKFKIIIIDEVHMLTNEAFNALLKTLEEPPEHVYFMFATTELHKIPITILSRCQRYDLQKISADELFNHFKSLAENEGITIEEKALTMIVREADGSVRDGLSLLDQIFSYGEKEISIDDVIDVLGLVNRDILLKLTESLLAGDATTALLSLDEIFTFGMDIKRFNNDLLDCFRTLLLCKIKGCASSLNLSETDLQSYQQLADKFSTETIHAKLNLLISAVEDISKSSQPRLVLETSFLKIIEAGNIVSVPELIGKLNQFIDKYPEPASSTTPPTPAVVKSEPSQPAAEKKSKFDTQVEKDKAEEVMPAKPYVAKTADSPKRHEVDRKPPQQSDEQQAEAFVPKATAPKQSADTPAPSSQDVQSGWDEFTNYVKQQKPWIGQVLKKASQYSEKNGEIVLEYDEHFTCSQLKESENHQLLTKLALDFFKKELKVRIIAPEDTSEVEGKDNIRMQKQRLSLDPLVIRTLEVFNGQIDDIRISPKTTGKNEKNKDQ